MRGIGGRLFEFVERLVPRVRRRRRTAALVDAEIATQDVPEGSFRCVSCETVQSRFAIAAVTKEPPGARPGQGRSSARSVEQTDGGTDEEREDASSQDSTVADTSGADARGTESSEGASFGGESSDGASIGETSGTASQESKSVSLWCLDCLERRESATEPTGRRLAGVDRD